MLQVFRKQVILEIVQADYLAVIADKSTYISGLTELVIVFMYINESSSEVVSVFRFIFVQNQ